jgi:hypothetical protein
MMSNLKNWKSYYVEICGVGFRKFEKNELLIEIMLYDLYNVVDA